MYGVPKLKFNYRPFSYTTFLLLVILSLSQNACDIGYTGPCGEGYPIDVYGNKTSFRLLDDSGVSLIGTRYHTSQVSVKYENGEEVSGLGVGVDGGFGFGFFITDPSEELEQDYNKNFYLILPEYPGIDIDTISASYRITDNGCNRTYEFINMKFNNVSYLPDDDPTNWEFLKQ